MRRVVLMNMVSLDGCFDGPGEGWERIDWHRADAEWGAYGIEVLSSADALLFGRRTYQGFADYWPRQPGEIARLLNEIPKVVFSTTLDRAEWSGTRLVRDDAAGEVARMKREGDGTLLIFGSGDFASTLTQSGLIDEYRLAFNPVVLGAGTPLFRTGGERLNLELLGARTFGTGVVLLSYAAGGTTS